jgi:hypothetical protein
MAAGNGAPSGQAKSDASSAADEAADLAARAATAARAELRGEREKILGAIGRALPAPLMRTRAVPERWTLVQLLAHFQ